MNMISQLRRRVSEDGAASLNIDEFNQLQAEWITRAKIEVVPPVAKLPEIDSADLEVSAWSSKGDVLGVAVGIKIKQKSTGIEVCCDTERHQQLNRAKCLNMLLAQEPKQ